MVVVQVSRVMPNLALEPTAHVEKSVNADSRPFDSVSLPAGSTLEPEVPVEYPWIGKARDFVWVVSGSDETGHSRSVDNDR